MKTFILGDTHGNWELAKRALIVAGAVDYDKITGTIKRKNTVTLIHVGDMLNCTRDSVEKDLECLRHCSVFDYIIVGNHEYPYWCNRTEATFKGFSWSDEVLKAIDVQRWRFKSCKAVGDIFVSHAGLSREYENIWTSAPQAATYIDKIWRTNPEDRLFSGIGRSRGGRDRYGGILWSDWSEAKARSFSQILGHTPGKKIRERQSTTMNTKQICIDVDGKHGKTVAGVWVEHEYNKPSIITPIIYESGMAEEELHRHIWVKRNKRIGGHECPCGETRDCGHPTCSCADTMICDGVKEVSL